MPVYDYKCNGCQSKFELKQSFRENSVTSCPVCQNQAYRIFSPVPVIFKGTGFYITDSRNNHHDPGDKDNINNEESGKKS